MALAPSRRLFWFSIPTSVLFVVAFPVMVHLVSGGELFGAFMIIPLTLVAWNRGERGGLVAALIGIGFTEAVFSSEHFLVRHDGLSAYWFMITIAPALVFLFVGALVGKFGDAHRELQATKELLAKSEAAAQQYLDIAQVMILVLDRDGRIVLLNRKGHAIFGYDDGQLLGKQYFSTCLPQEIRTEVSVAFERMMNGESGLESHENLISTRGGETRLIAWRNTPLRDGDGRIVGSLSSGEDITEHRKAQKALVESSEHLNALLNAIPDMLFEVDKNGVYYDFRTASPEQLVFPQTDSMIGKRIDEVLPPESAQPIMDAITRAAETGHSMSPAIALTNKGVAHWRELSIAPIGDFRKDDCHFVLLERDVSDRVRLEQQLIQSQKMESVGRLAGGIAHDFNNILQVILGYCEILQELGESGEKVRKYVKTIRDSADRAASLTMQLLAFSRKQNLDFKIVDVDALIEQSRGMLAKMLGEDIVLEHESGKEEALVRADPGQLQQVVMNLAVNARDAMADGGKLTISVKRVVLAPHNPKRRAEMAPGEYVELTVNDTGAGMDEETLSHLFEPFFTTKELGKGTGLGLSIVYGIVKQSHGFVYAESRLGLGSTFRIYLPLVVGDREDPTRCREEASRGNETVLVVEDEGTVRELVVRQLRSCGYNVLVAVDGNEALRVCEQHPDGIHLLLTDVVLPGIKGGKVSEAFRLANSQGRIVFMSGYTDPGIFVDLADRGKAVFLQKPFTLSTLSRTIRKALDEA